MYLIQPFSVKIFLIWTALCLKPDEMVFCDNAIVDDTDYYTDTQDIKQQTTKPKEPSQPPTQNETKLKAISNSCGLIA